MYFIFTIKLTHVSEKFPNGTSAQLRTVSAIYIMCVCLFTTTVVSK